MLSIYFHSLLDSVLGCILRDITVVQGWEWKPRSYLSCLWYQTDGKDAILYLLYLYLTSLLCSLLLLNGLNKEALSLILGSFLLHLNLGL